MDINTITVSGNVGKSPTSIKNDDVLYANFSLAVNVGTKDSPKTLWYSITASGKTAEVVLNHVKAGDKLFITGTPSVDTYLGKDKQIIGVQKIWIKKFQFGGSNTLENNKPVMEIPDLKLEDTINNIDENQLSIVNIDNK